MTRIIEEVLLIRGHRTTTRRHSVTSMHMCALCKSEAELISVAAGARLVKVDSLELCERLGRLAGPGTSAIRPGTLVCLECLYKCRIRQLGSGL